MAETDTIGLDDLIRDIVEHLAETDAKYRAYVATRLHAHYSSDDDVMFAIGHALDGSEPEAIIELANECLSQTYSYDGDSLVTVTCKDDASPAAP